MDEYFCLYSQNVITKFIYGVGHVPFVIRCEILFEWEDYGTSNFCANVYYAKQESPDKICGWVEVGGLADDNYPCFSGGRVVENRSGIEIRSMEVESIIAASDLLHDVNNFLQSAELPTLY